MEELKDFNISWSINIRAEDIDSAADRAYDILRGRQPLSLAVSERDFESGGVINTIGVIPHLESCVTHTAKRFLPGCDVQVEHAEDGIGVTIIADHFRDIPSDDDREEFMKLIFNALPNADLDEFSFYCYTQDEWLEVEESENE
jgi:hypothetical protein